MRNQLRKQNYDEEFGNLTLFKKKTIGGIINKMICGKINLKLTGRGKWVITRGLKFTATATIPTIITRLSANTFVSCAILPMAASTRLGLVFKRCQVFSAKSSAVGISLGSSNLLLIGHMQSRPSSSIVPLEHGCIETIPANSTHIITMDGNHMY